jgi:hypothetical protein
MAYKSCAAKIAASIQQDCNKPLVGGYTGRAVIMSATDFERAEVVQDAANPREILSIVLPPDGSVMAYTIDNVFAAPFTGSTTAGNNENGRNGYLKTLSVRVPMRGADVSRDVIEPMVKDPNGFVVIAEKRDKVGDGSYEVIGYQNALRGDIAGVTRDESANGSDWIVPLTTVEKWAEVTLVGAAETYESAKKEFEGLFGFEPMITRMVLTEDSDEVEISANGLVIVEYVQNGEKVRNSYSSLSGTYVPIPAGTEVTVYGSVTDINKDGNSNVFSSLDVSKNTALTYLYCGGCTGLTSLDLSKNTALTYLYCNGCTGLTSLDLSKNTALTYLDCYGCTGLTSLDVSKNTALTYLDCNGCTGLTSLDLSKNTALTYLDCNGCTGLTSLDLSKNIALTDLYCYDCTGLTSLDLSKNTALTYLDCYGSTGLTSLDVSKNTALTYLDCNGCTGLTSLDLSKSTALTTLYCGGCTGLTSLDLSKNTALTYLDCNGCQNLLMLNIKNTAELANGGILDQLMANLTTLQVAGTSAWAYEQVESWLSDFAPDNGMIYVDENTPQGVITEAEGKSWEVVYVS